MKSVATATEPSMPLFIKKVEVVRVHGNLIRVIQHNMELLQQLAIEVISVPELVLL